MIVFTFCQEKYSKKIPLFSDGLLAKKLIFILIWLLLLIQVIIKFTKKKL